MVYMVSMLLFFNVQYVIINFDKKGSKINDLGWFNLKIKLVKFIKPFNNSLEYLIIFLS
jgi:hypothetical protein